MKKHKKPIIILSAAVVLIATIAVGVIVARKNSRRAYVQPVSEMNIGMYGGDEMTYSGQVYESAQQKIFAGSDKVIKEVYVESGDKVKKGDKLFSYDTTLLELDVEEKQLTVSICESALTTEQERLEEYKNIAPYEEPAAEPSADDETDEDAVDEEPAAQTDEGEQKHYTAQEKADLITNQELTVRKAQTSLESAKQDLTEAQEALENATVVSQFDGTVADIKSPDTQNNATAFCTVIGNTGVTVKGYVGEFDLKTLAVGDQLTVSSWMTGSMTDAEVLSINDYPADTQIFANYGNPNTSYYEFTAFMDDADGFDIGEEVEIVKYDSAPAERIILPKIYVRTDEKGSYVMKDVDGVLTRQEVQITKTNSEDTINVIGGLTNDDLIAFPYGSLSQAGLLTTTEQGVSLF